MAKATNQSTDLTSAGFLKGLEILLEGPDKDLYKVGKPVPAQDADRCKKQFEELMDVEDHHDLVYFRFKRSDTLSVTFTGKDLLDWLKEMIALGPGVVNNIRVTFGIYDADFARTHNPISMINQQKTGRFSCRTRRSATIQPWRTSTVTDENTLLSMFPNTLSAICGNVQPAASW